VAELIRVTEPDVVFLELCDNRRCVLTQKPVSAWRTGRILVLAGSNTRTHAK
jgi:pheromone shutdown protein TraB